MKLKMGADIEDIVLFEKKESKRDRYRRTGERLERRRQDEEGDIRGRKRSGGRTEGRNSDRKRTGGKDESRNSDRKRADGKKTDSGKTESGRTEARRSDSRRADSKTRDAVKANFVNGFLAPF